MGLDFYDLEDNLSAFQNISKRKFPFQGGTLMNAAVQTMVEELGHTLQQRLSLIDVEYGDDIKTISITRIKFDIKKQSNYSMI